MVVCLPTATFSVPKRTGAKLSTSTSAGRVTQRGAAGAVGVRGRGTGRETGERGGVKQCPHRACVGRGRAEEKTEKSSGLRAGEEEEDEVEVRDEVATDREEEENEKQEEEKKTEEEKKREGKERGELESDTDMLLSASGNETGRQVQATRRGVKRGRGGRAVKSAEKTQQEETEEEKEAAQSDKDSEDGSALAE